MLKLLLLFVFIIFLFRRWWHRRRKIQCCEQFKNDIPALPIMGYAHLLLGNAEKRMQALQMFGREALKQGGVTAGCSWILDYYYIVVADPIVAEIVMKNYLEKEDIIKLAKDMPGFGIVTAPVSEWRPIRKTMNRIFNLNLLSKFMDTFIKNNNIMVEELKGKVDIGPFPIFDYITRCCLDSVCKTILDKELGSQKNHKHYFKEALNTCFEVIAERVVSPWLYSHTVFDMTPSSKLFKENTDKISECIGPVISEKLEQYKDKTKSTNLLSSNTIPKTMLQIMIENAANEEPASLEKLREQSMAVIVGASKPAPIAFSFVMVMLASHSDVQDKVYNEISEVLGHIDRPIEADDLPRLKYLEAVIKETIRLYPPVPVIAREIDKDIELPDGRTLVEGTGVFIHIWAVHRNTKYWGADAEEFRPERFLEPLTHPAAFLGFSYGVRNCLGFQYAIMSLKISITSVLRQFRVMPANKQTDKQVPLRVGIDILLRHIDDFNIQLKSR